MQRRSHGEFAIGSDVAHVSEIDGAYVNNVLSQMESSFNAFILAKRLPCVYGHYLS